MGADGTPVYTQRYVEALAYAADLHATQMRKSDAGTPATIPVLRPPARGVGTGVDGRR